MSEDEVVLRVRLKGVELWWLRYGADESGPLAPLEHCDEKGNLNSSKCFKDESYGYVTPDGRVMRYREQIGVREDIEVIE